MAGEGDRISRNGEQTDAQDYYEADLWLQGLSDWARVLGQGRDGRYPAFPYKQHWSQDSEGADQQRLWPRGNGG